MPPKKKQSNDEWGTADQKAIVRKWREKHIQPLIKEMKKDRQAEHLQSFIEDLELLEARMLPWATAKPEASWKAQYDYEALLAQREAEEDEDDEEEQKTPKSAKKAATKRGRAKIPDSEDDDEDKEDQKKKKKTTRNAAKAASPKKTSPKKASPKKKPAIPKSVDAAQASTLKGSKKTPEQRAAEKSATTEPPRGRKRPKVEAGETVQAPPKKTKTKASTKTETTRGKKAGASSSKPETGTHDPGQSPARNTRARVAKRKASEEPESGEEEVRPATKKTKTAPKAAAPKTSKTQTSPRSRKSPAAQSPKKTKSPSKKAGKQPAKK